VRVETFVSTSERSEVSLSSELRVEGSVGAGRGGCLVSRTMAIPRGVVRGRTLGRVAWGAVDQEVELMKVQVGQIVKD